MEMKERTIIFCGSFGPAIKDRGETIVKRWHVLPVQQKEETLAGHTFDVLVNAWVIGRALALLGHKDEFELLTLLECAGNCQLGIHLLVYQGAQENLKMLRNVRSAI